MKVAALLLVLLVACTQAFYLPGVAPVEYIDGDDVPLKVNKLVSSKTQLPYPYYSLAFCQPEGGIQDVAENLGEILMGDKIENSPYKVRFLSLRVMAGVINLSHRSKLVLWSPVRSFARQTYPQIRCACSRSA